MTSNSIELAFGDGTYVFALPLAQIAELQRKTGTGIGGLYARLIKGCIPIDGKFALNPGMAEFFALDVVETIRHGLIGGGKGEVNGEEVEVTPVMASKLIDAYVVPRPFVESWKVAATVIGACILGYDPPKKVEPAAKRAPAKRARKKAGSTTSAP
jgi:hypothetical protein